MELQLILPSANARIFIRYCNTLLLNYHLLLLFNLCFCFYLKQSIAFVIILIIALFVCSTISSCGPLLILQRSVIIWFFLSYSVAVLVGLVVPYQVGLRWACCMPRKAVFLKMVGRISILFKANILYQSDGGRLRLVSLYISHTEMTRTYTCIYDCMIGQDLSRSLYTHIIAMRNKK